MTHLIELRDYKSNEAVFVDPNEISSISRLPETDESQSRTRITLKRNDGMVLLVLEMPSLVFALINALEDRLTREVILDSKE